MSYKITVRQGDTFAFTVTYKSGGVAVDLTGYTAETWCPVNCTRSTMAARRISPLIELLRI